MSSVLLCIMVESWRHKLSDEIVPIKSLSKNCSFKFTPILQITVTSTVARLSDVMSPKTAQL